MNKLDVRFTIKKTMLNRRYYSPGEYTKRKEKGFYEISGGKLNFLLVPNKI